MDKRERSKKVLEDGLRDKVASYIMSRRSGRVRIAKALKKEIDQEIKSKNLDYNEVYFYYGDPDDPKNKN